MSVYIIRSMKTITAGIMDDRCEITEKDVYGQKYDPSFASSPESTSMEFNPKDFYRKAKPKQMKPLPTISTILRGAGATIAGVAFLTFIAKVVVWEVLFIWGLW